MHAQMRKSCDHINFTVIFNCPRDFSSSGSTEFLSLLNFAKKNSFFSRLNFLRWSWHISPHFTSQFKLFDSPLYCIFSPFRRHRFFASLTNWWKNKIWNGSVFLCASVVGWCDFHAKQMKLRRKFLNSQKFNPFDSHHSSHQFQLVCFCSVIARDFKFQNVIYLNKKYSLPQQLNWFAE